jgi:hypothetical protein
MVAATSRVVGGSSSSFVTVRRMSTRSATSVNRVSRMAAA